MVTFKALNIESDHDTDDEVDDTKEIQIEEALRLYQTALKYHSQGPQSYDKAADAYRALFESEIFKYPESHSEIRRLELYGPTQDYENAFEEEPEIDQVVLAGSTDSAPSTLPQILHLSYKNHGEFMLELLQSRLNMNRSEAQAHAPAQGVITPTQVSGATAAALDYFVEALDKDDTDLDLWRRTAAVGGILGSSRIARFCLEAVLDGDDEGLKTLLNLPGLEEGFALQQLKTLVTSLQDDLSLAQAPLSQFKRRHISAVLDKRLNVYASVAPPLTKRMYGRAISSKTGQRKSLPAPSDWAGVGEAIYSHILAEQSGMVDVTFSSGICFDMAPHNVQHEETLAHTTSPTEVAKVNGLADASRSEEPAYLPVEPEIILSPTAAGEVTAVGEATVAAATEEGETKAVEATGVTATLPTRKRSSDAAGLPETAEGGRVRSKRIRARESIVESNTPQVLGPDLRQQYEAQLSTYVHADHWLFEVVGGLLRVLRVSGLGSIHDLRSTVEENGPLDGDSILNDLSIATKDFYNILQTSTNDLATCLHAAELVNDAVDSAQNAGLAAFMDLSNASPPHESTKPLLSGDHGLSHFCHRINSDWMTLKEAAWVWLECLLRRGSFPRPNRSEMSGFSSYTGHRWPEVLKVMVVRMMVHLDDFTHQRMVDEYSAIQFAIRKAQKEFEQPFLPKDRLPCIEMIQTLYELHLDVCTRIKHPKSGVDLLTQTLQADRLERWSVLAREAIMTSCAEDDGSTWSDLLLRHVWASVLHAALVEDVAQEHVVLCIEDLKRMLAAAGNTSIEIPNNAVMPELSAAEADRELSKLKTREFFHRVFAHDQEDPVSVIENLEPLLEMSIPEVGALGGSGGDEDVDVPSSMDEVEDASASNAPPNDQGPLSHELAAFLDSGNVSLRLLLWQRLREAYEAIDYLPKVVSCHFRAIELLVAELKTGTYKGNSKEMRHVTLLKSLRMLDNLLSKALLAVKKSGSMAFECIGNEHLISTMSALAELSRLLHPLNLLEDSVRVGQKPPPTPAGQTSSSLPLVASKVHDMQIRTWTLLYLLFKEGICQNGDMFLTPEEDRLDFLHSVHYATGIRGFCNASNREFLKLLMDELPQLTRVENYEIEFAQALFDMYGMKCFLNPALCQDHDCVALQVDKTRVVPILEFVMSQANKINIRDLPKTELKNSMDRIHGVLPKRQITNNMLRNRDLYKTYMKSPINPLSLYQCFDGVGQLSSAPIADPTSDQAVAASKGWYFLMGHIALSRFRSQKRTSPGPTEDIDIAIALFLQDLEYSMDKWETWYRLGQAYDCKIEESVVWSADKLNNNSRDVVQFQRGTIHCYTLAVALAVRSADTAFETSSKVSDLYADFGMRMYASSRPPFDMQAFSLSDFERFFSLDEVRKAQPFAPLTSYAAWKVAAKLFRRAIVGKPESWMNHYMLGKSLWKMHTATHHQSDVPRRAHPPSVHVVINAFARAIEALLDRRDSRKEPTLEPHYKLVSIVHKMVRREELNAAAAIQVLEATHYFRRISFTAPELEVWDIIVMKTLKSLRAADKSNWHHRMISRIAHVLYDDREGDSMAAEAAKHELTQQMFTKTMVIQVWKPSYERAGRHFVYTSDYLLFFVRILEQLRDRASLEALAKRALCQTYVRVLRRFGNIPDGLEATVFGDIDKDFFAARKGALEVWCHDSTNKSPVIETLRDAIDLKRLNVTLMKPLLIDDLIGDTYAKLWRDVGPTLWSGIDSPLQEAVPAPVEPRSNMMSLTNMMNSDGAADVAPQPLPIKTEVSAPTKTRAKGIGRREIRQCAEGTVGRPPAPPPPVTKPLPRPPDPHVQVVIEARNREGNGLMTAESSVPGSIHDDADDESELSDVDEDVVNEGEEEQVVKDQPPKRPMFPGLAVRIAPVPASPVHAADSQAETENSSGPLAIEQSNVQNRGDDAKERSLVGGT
ncbi:hypothetical protein B0A49_05302 [Cryomyces minteri]|uniref:Histone transcription regulator 3 homolog n=1 Tax=Cryomyces minteri TaxID=331657 RepID=A0A4U0XDK7_9PEZI|nr:hypothetical protein B0A49_05302 [Cryomyces minteri]